MGREIPTFRQFMFGLLSYWKEFQREDSEPDILQVLYDEVQFNFSEAVREAVKEEMGRLTISVEMERE